MTIPRAWLTIIGNPGGQYRRHFSPQVGSVQAFRARIETTAQITLLHFLLVPYPSSISFSIDTSSRGIVSKHIPSE